MRRPVSTYEKIMLREKTRFGERRDLSLCSIAHVTASCKETQLRFRGHESIVFVKSDSHMAYVSSARYSICYKSTQNFIKFQFRIVLGYTGLEMIRLQLVVTSNDK